MDFIIGLFTISSLIVITWLISSISAYTWEVISLVIIILGTVGIVTLIGIIIRKGLTDDYSSGIQHSTIDAPEPECHDPDEYGF